MMAARIQLRLANEADVPALTRLLRRSWLVAWAPELPFEAVQVFAAADPARLHAEKCWSGFLVAEVDGGMAGAVEVVSDFVESLHVDSAWWGQGIGSMLLDKAELQIAHAYPAAKLEVRAFNARALAFYGRRGWVETRRYPGTECGVPVDTVEMIKSLATRVVNFDEVTRTPA